MAYQYELFNPHDDVVVCIITHINNFKAAFKKVRFILPSMYIIECLKLNSKINAWNIFIKSINAYNFLEKFRKKDIFFDILYKCWNNK